MLEPISSKTAESKIKLGFSRPGLPQVVNFPLCLAPMVGLSHQALREALREYLPAGAVTLWPSEMLNSRRVPDENLSKTPEAMRTLGEHYWVPQILGNEEIPIRESAKKLFDFGASGLDINMGCPVKKALKHNYGVALMGDPDYAAKVVDMAVTSFNGPVSVKLRAGVETDIKVLSHFVNKLQNAGASWLTIHPREAEKKRKGAAHWSQIKMLRDRLEIPVIGNGDIQTVEDVLDMTQQTGCDMVMAGRVLTVRPWLFWQLGERLGWAPPFGKTGLAPSTPEEEGREYGKFLLNVNKKMQEYFPENLAQRKFIFLVKTGAVWLKFGHYLYGRVTYGKNMGDMYEQVEKFFSTPQELMSKTTLAE